MGNETVRGRASSGIQGLDSILGGGLPEGSSCLVRGGPGTGKTTIGAHFLAAGTLLGERTLNITLGEDRKSVVRNAAQVGIDLSQVSFLDLSPSSGHFEKSESPTLFSPAELERDQITKMIIEKMGSVRPKRVLLDSSSHLRLLSIDAMQFRKQLLGLVRYLLAHDTTLMITSEASPEVPDHETRHLCDGVVSLSMEEEWRYVEVTKLRSSGFRAGKHSLRLGQNGCAIYPVLRPQEHRVKFTAQVQPSEVEGVDQMLCGGIERGTTTLITGPSGAGKTTLSLQFAQAAARRGERAVVFTFEESSEAIAYRASSLGFSLDATKPSNVFEIRSIEPLLVSADEISHMVRHEVEQKRCSFFVLDSVAGFRLSVKSRNLVVDLRSMLKYLTNMGVTVIVINEVEMLTGDFRATELGISFLADNLIFLRYLEIRGEMRKAIGVLKKRLSDFERYLREFAVTKEGIRIGPPLVGIRGILSGKPECVDEEEQRPGARL